MVEEFKAEDLRLVNRVLHEFPAVWDLIHAVKTVLKRTRFVQKSRTATFDGIQLQKLAGSGDTRGWRPLQLLASHGLRAVARQREPR